MDERHAKKIGPICQRNEPRLRAILAVFPITGVEITPTNTLIHTHPDTILVPKRRHHKPVHIRSSVLRTLTLPTRKWKKNSRIYFKKCTTITARPFISQKQKLNKKILNTFLKHANFLQCNHHFSQKT